MPLGTDLKSVPKRKTFDSPLANHFFAVMQNSRSLEQDAVDIQLGAIWFSLQALVFATSRNHVPGRRRSRHRFCRSPSHPVINIAGLPASVKD
jgi:hypothetical protein